MPSKNPDRLLSLAALALAVCLLPAIGLPTFGWGLPSFERNVLAFGPTGTPTAIPKLSAEDVDRLWEDYPNHLPGGPQRKGKLPRSAFNPIRAFHPDEYVILKGLAQMRPMRLKLFHGFFGWPSLQFYVTGVALGVARAFGFVALRRDIAFYFQHPEEMAKMYLVGRAATLLMSAAAVVFVWAGVRRLYGPLAAATAALFLATSPLLTVNCHYLTADAPMLMWIAIAFWSSSRILRHEHLRWYFIGGAAVGLAAATRYQGALSCFVVFSAHVFRGGPPLYPRGRLGRTTAALRHALGDPRIWMAGLASILAFLLTNIYALSHPIEFWRELSLEFGSAHAERPPLQCLFGVLWYGFGPGLTAGAALGLVIAWRRRRRRDWFVFWAFVPAFAFLLASRPTMARYWMPVLILPVAFAARGVSEWMQGLSQPTSSARRVTAIVAAALVFVLGLAQSIAYARLYLPPTPRIEAGRWIAKNAPTGARVAILADRETVPQAPAPVPADPWQFQLPPMDAERLRLVGIPMNTRVLADVRPDYLVVGDYQLPPLANREPMDMDEYDFMDAIEDTSRYEKICFRNRPTLLGVVFEPPFLPPPHDLRYADPGITVYRRLEVGG